MLNYFIRLILVLFFYGGPMIVYSGEPLNSAGCDSCCLQQDIVDLLFKGHNPFSSNEKKRIRFIGVPLIAYDPATDLQLGLGGSFSIQFGNPHNTKISAGMSSAIYTTKKQFIIQWKSNIFFPGNRWLLQSDWRYYIFTLPTYTLGSNSHALFPPVPGYSEVFINPRNKGRYQVDYYWLKFHNIFSRKVFRNIYLGMGYHLDYHYNILDRSLYIVNDTLYNTPHYSYSILHGFNPDHYISSGISADFVFDSRDNMLNAYKGVFININYRYNPVWLGSSRNGSELWTEFRTYIPLSKKCPRHLLAFWYYGKFAVTGDIPYLDLMSISYDQMNSSGRGYSQGQFRGEDFMYGEVEYRFPISPHSHILGGVIFTNVCTSSNRDMGVPLFGYFKPSAGAGIRIMVGKRDRTNIAIDFGIGDSSTGVYIQSQEVF